MKRKLFKYSIFHALLICISILLYAQLAIAGKPVKAPAGPTIYSVVVDALNSKVIVTGESLDVVTEAILGGVDVSGDLLLVNANHLEINYSLAMAGAVPTAGSYSLSLNGTPFYAFFSSPVTDPGIVSGCPCQPEWDSFGSALPPDGFSGLEPICATESTNGDQVAVQFYNPDYAQIWILTTEYNANATQCALVLDAPTRELSLPQEHTACATYLKSNFITPYPALPDCF